MRCPEAQALTRRVVDPAADLAQHLWRQSGGICIEREKATEPPLVFSTVPFCKEPAGCRSSSRCQAMPEDGVARELRAAVEGDGLPSRGGQGPQLLDHSCHDARMSSDPGS
jgi:hypothetical protein